MSLDKTTIALGVIAAVLTMRAVVVV